MINLFLLGVSTLHIETIYIPCRKKPRVLKAWVGRLSKALRRDLDHCMWYWFYDTLRRMVLLGVLAPITGTYDYPRWWMKNLQGQILLSLLLLFHVWKKPYYVPYDKTSPRNDHTCCARFRQWVAETFDKFKKNRWYYINAAILFNLMLICQLTTSSGQGGLPNNNDERVDILKGLVSGTVLFGLLVFAWQFGLCFVITATGSDKLCKKCSCCHDNGVKTPLLSRSNSECESIEDSGGHELHEHAHL